MNQVLRAMQIALEAQNCGHELMKTTIKHENDEFLFITLKHVSGLKVNVKRPGTPKLWEIAYQNGHKHENCEFWVISLQHVSGHKVVVNRPRNPKQWTIAHENGHKTRKLRVFSHKSQTCNGSYRPCKSNWNPNIVGNNS